MAARAHGSRRIVAVVLAAAYSLGAAATTPFTGQADLLTALPIVALAVAVVVRWPLRARPRVDLGAGPDERRGIRRHPYAAWIVVLAAVVAWELVQYASAGSRALHPTLSSMADAVDRNELLKAVVFFAWLCLGAAILHAGTASRLVTDGAGVGGDAP